MRKHLVTSIGYFEIRDSDIPNPVSHKGGFTTPAKQKYKSQIVFIRPDGTEEKLETLYETRKLAALAVGKHVTGLEEWDGSTEQLTEDLSDWLDGPAPRTWPPPEQNK
jgi:hypothetical protein